MRARIVLPPGHLLRECRYAASVVVDLDGAVDVEVVGVGSVVVEPPGVVDRATVKGPVDGFVPSWPTVTMVGGTVLPREAKSNLIDGAQRVKKLRPLTPRDLLNANVMSCRAIDNNNEWRAARGFTITDSTARVAHPVPAPHRPRARFHSRPSSRDPSQTQRPRCSFCRRRSAPETTPRTQQPTEQSLTTRLPRTPPYRRQMPVARYVTTRFLAEPRPRPRRSKSPREQVPRTRVAPPVEATTRRCGPEIDSFRPRSPSLCRGQRGVTASLRGGRRV